MAKNVKNKKCIVCGSIDDNSILHMLPVDVVRRNDWLKSILELNPTAVLKKYSKIYHMHFKKSDVLGHNMLKISAIPTFKGFLEIESPVFDLGLDLLADVRPQADVTRQVGSDIVKMEVDEEGYVIIKLETEFADELPELPNQQKGDGDHSCNEPTTFLGKFAELPELPIQQERDGDHSSNEPTTFLTIPNNNPTAKRSKKTRKSLVGDFNISDMSDPNLAKSFFITVQANIESKIKKIAILRRKMKFLEQKLPSTRSRNSIGALGVMRAEGTQKRSTFLKIAK